MAHAPALDNELWRMATRRAEAITKGEGDQVLQSFLDRPQPYHGEAAVALLQAQARINLAAALSRLA